MFSGRYRHSVDAKGRVALPAPFREELSRLQDEFLFVTRFVRRKRHCLDVFPQSAWDELLERVRRLPFGPKKDAFVSFYVGAAQSVSADAQGRVLVGPAHREWAQLGREVIVTGASEKFRIWNADVFEQIDREDQEEIFGDPEFFTELGL